MYLWRVSNYANLDGAGGLYATGRWHTMGHPVVYGSLNPSTAMLEMLVHLNVDSEDRPKHLHILKIAVPDLILPESVEALPAGWRNQLGLTRDIGDGWLAGRRSLLLKVPSALLPETWNVLINPLHPQASQLKIAVDYDHALDPRLLQ